MIFKVLPNPKHSVILSGYDACPATAESGIPSGPEDLMENKGLHSQTDHRPEKTGLESPNTSRAAGREQFCLIALSSKIVSCLAQGCCSRIFSGFLTPLASSFSITLIFFH